MKNEKKKQEIREFCRLLKLRTMGGGFEEAVEGAENYISFLSAQVQESDDRGIHAEK